MDANVDGHLGIPLGSLVPEVHPGAQNVESSLVFAGLSRPLLKSRRIHCCWYSNSVRAT